MRLCRSALAGARHWGQCRVVVSRSHLQTALGAWLALARNLFRNASAALGNVGRAAMNPGGVRFLRQSFFSFL